MSYRLGGLNPLAYRGVTPLQPPNMEIQERNPISGAVANSDWRNFNIGTLWTNTVNQTVWALVDRTNNGPLGNPTWIQLGVSPVSVVTSLQGNDGVIVMPTAGIVQVFTDNTTVMVKGAGSRETIDFGLTNLILGSDAASASGTENVGLGQLALSALTSGSSNTAIGWASATSLTTGNDNTSLGAGSLGLLITGSSNITIGTLAGVAYTTSESNNIMIGNTGTIGDSGVMYFGTEGTQTSAYMAGVSGITTDNPTIMTIDSVTYQLGSMASSSGIVTIDGNTGSVTGATITLETANATPIFSGSASTMTLNFGLTNLALGSSLSSASGTENVAFGDAALTVMTTGNSNSAFGWQAGTALTTGSNNTLLGSAAATTLLTGGSNIIIGSLAGSNYTTSESNNILIGSAGTLAESNAIHIGHTQTYAAMAGIYNQTVGGTNAAVFIDSTGRLGTLGGGGGGGSITGLRANDGNIALPLSGIVDVYGDSNTNTTAATANTLIVHLDDSVSIPGSMTVGSGFVATAGGANLTGTITLPTVGGPGVMQTNGSGVVSSTQGTNGQVLISGGSAPIWANLTAGTNITITNPSPNNITIASSGGGGSLNTLTGNTGGAIAPVSGNINIVTANSSPVFAGTVGTLTLDFNKSHLVLGSAFATNALSSQNVAIGSGVGQNLTGQVSGTVMIGYQACGGAGSAGVIGNGVYIGSQSGFSINNNNATWNTGVGTTTLFSITSGQFNTVIGGDAGTLLSTTSNNTFVGYRAGQDNIGTGNTFIGSQVDNGGVGANYNVYLGFGIFGSSGEANVMRLGASTSMQAIAATYIAGITGVTVSSSAAVLINTSTGQLGTISSSIRYKDNIENMDDASGLIYDLRPVTFTYKSNGQKASGLIAEEVYDSIPELVNLDSEGRPDSVKYHDLPILLLNELQKAYVLIRKLEDKVERLEKKLK
jgi:hypothetical protein